MKNRATFIALLSFALAGCATVINGTSQDVQFKSDPQGALVRLTDGTSCTTPCKVSLKRRHDLRADFTKDGYKPVYVLVQSRTGGAAAGNILLGGLIGGVVDGSNGATNHLAPNPVSVRLVPLGSDAKEVLFDKKGKETGTVEANNDKVRQDVAKTIGAEAAGLNSVPAPAPAPAAQPDAAPAPASPPADPAPGATL